MPQFYSAPFTHLLACARCVGHIRGVRTLAEIQEAIEKLPPQEKEALSTWLSSHEEAPISAREEASLLASLYRAEKQLDSGQGVPLSKARNMVRKWVSK